MGEAIEGPVEELFELQEALAARVRNSLVGESRQTLIKSRPTDSDAYDSYTRGIYALEHRGTPGNIETAIDLFQYAIRQDEEFGPSYLALATLYALLPNYRDAERAEMDLFEKSIGTNISSSLYIFGGINEAEF